MRYIYIYIKKNLEKTQEETQMKFYNVMAGPTLLYGSELWVLKRKGCSLLPAPRMIYLGSVKDFTWLNCFRNEDIRRQLSPIPIIANICGNRRGWEKHYEWMDREFPRSPLGIIPMVEEMWDVQERDGHCEVRTGQRSKPWKDFLSSWFRAS